MDDLVQFLRARLDEDAALAGAASPGPWSANAEADEVLAVDGVTVADGFALSSRQLRATTEHIARHNPARVLAEVEAKRRAVNECAYWNEKLSQEAANPSKYPQPGLGLILDAVNPILRALALAYADHPAYRPAWRP